jgi:hypothetical protein
MNKLFIGKEIQITLKHFLKFCNFAHKRKKYGQILF